MTRESKSIVPIASKKFKCRQTVQNQRRIVNYDNRTYSWTGKRWVDIATFTCPPEVILNQLDAILLLIQLEEDDEISDVPRLLDRAKNAIDQKHYTRAESLSRKALLLSPDYPGTLAVLCSCLRLLNRPEDAVKISESHKMVEYPPLILARAAALCDIENWEEARIEVRKVLAIAKKHSSWGYSNIQAIKIINRIKSIRPNLF